MTLCAGPAVPRKLNSLANEATVRYASYKMWCAYTVACVQDVDGSLVSSVSCARELSQHWYQTRVRQFQSARSGSVVVAMASFYARDTRRSASDGLGPRRMNFMHHAPRTAFWQVTTAVRKRLDRDLAIDEASRSKAMLAPITPEKACCDERSELSKIQCRGWVKVRDGRPAGDASRATQSVVGAIELPVPTIAARRGQDGLLRDEAYQFGHWLQLETGCPTARD
jgi:hypothetical protein